MAGTKQSKSPLKASTNKTNNTKSNNKTKNTNTVSNNKPKKTLTLQQIVTKHPHFQFLENGKIRCLISGHQMLPEKANFDKHLESRSYKKALEAQFDISDFQQFLIDHKQWPKSFFFCKLTGKKVPKKKSAIQKHLSGKRFQRRLAEWQQMQESEQEEQNGVIEEEQEEDQEDQQEQMQDKK